MSGDHPTESPSKSVEKDIEHQIEKEIDGIILSNSVDDMIERREVDSSQRAKTIEFLAAVTQRHPVPN